jgi:hypothetical protein
MKRTIKYKCKANDVDLTFKIESGKIDEVWVSVRGMEKKEGWTVIGYEDLIEGIKKAGNAIP